MFVTVFGPADTQNLLVSDSASTLYGTGSDKCGAYNYVLQHLDGTTDVSPFITLSGGVFTLQTNDLARENTSYDLLITVQLVDYPSISSNQQFSASIGVCVVTGLTEPTNPGP